MQVMHNAHTATAFPIHSRSLNSETGCQLNKHFDCWTVTGQIYNATHNGPTSNTFRINGEYLISSLIFPSKYFCEEGEVRFVSMANSNGHRRIGFDRRFRNCCKWFCTRRNIFLPKKTPFHHYQWAWIEERWKASCMETRKNSLIQCDWRGKHIFFVKKLYLFIIET